MRFFALQWTHLLALRVVYHYKLAHAVPLEGSASYAEIARQCGLREDLTFRFLRVNMSNHIFDEDPTTGHVRHTAASRLLVTKPEFADAVGLESEELAPAAAHVIRAWDKWGQDAAVSEPSRTGFALANGTEQHIFEILAAQPERAKRFAGAMDFYKSDDAWDLRHILEVYDWKTQLDWPGSRVIDVGGGKGTVSQFLTRHTDHARFLVQDLPHVVTAARVELPHELSSRVEFAPHNFLEPQDFTSATLPDAFLLRWILHDWPDNYCVRILRSLVPAMQPGTKLLIYESVIDDLPVRDLSGRFGLQLDMVMGACFNGRERRRVDFEKLLEESDERFVLKAVRKASGSTMGMIEVTWKG